MITRSSRRPFVPLTILLLWIFSSSIIFGQELINGVINKYGKVTSVGAGFVVIGNLGQVAQFNAGDYVLLIQMQGVGILTDQGFYGKTIQTVFGTPGGYELLIIQSVNYGNGTVTFTRNLVLSYDVTANVQLVQVPFYDSPTVTSTLTSDTWNSTSGTGGVLAMLIGRKLTLNADIDVTGKGFAGAAGVFGIGECVYTNIPADGLDSYPSSWNNAGFKGEGVAIHDYTGTLLSPNHVKGQGNNFTGGGGGNGWFSGGGGGSNRGKGGDGGLEKFVLGQCGNDPHEGGYGGVNFIATSIQNGIFLGGGGGASTQAAGSTASSGGNGGGIVIIIADSIDANSHVIRSNGISAGNAVSDAGSGGGGAGGSVALSFQGFTTQVQISSNGGNGGTNPGGFGAGGGGGGGLIWFSSSTTPSPVSGATVSYGTVPPTTPSEGTGEIKYNFVPRLNGFLFNSIRAAATGNKVDSVCSNTMYGQITGTNPVGGTPPYTFEWQSSTTSSTTGFTTAPGVSNLQHYTPPALLSQSTWFRRVVTDNGATITDISLPVRIIVHQSIKNNSIGNPDTLCYGQNASALNSLLTLLDGNGRYSFTWESSTDNVTFSDASNSTESYLPPAGLTQTTWYRRIVNSGACIDVSPSVRINVLPVISNNTILSSPEEICQGMTFTNLSATISPALSGGDNAYRYRWESSNDGTTWATATGSSSGTGYDPSESAAYFPGHQYFRRVVLSGSNNVCMDASASVLLNAYPVITNNQLVSGDQTICSGATPVQLAGSVPLNGKGAGSYTYTWQDSTRSHIWANISGFVGVTNQNFQPPALTDTTRYRRIALSSACLDISKSVIIRVHKPIASNAVSLLSGGPADTTICSGAVPHPFKGTPATGGTNIPGDYAYQWSSSSDNVTWSDITTSATGLNYQPPALTSTTYFRRRAISGQCSSESIPVKITVLPLITNNNISADQAVCKSNTPAILGQASGASLTGGSGTYSFYWEQSRDGIAWNPAAGTNNLSNGTYQPPVMTRTMQYRRAVKSGSNDCCTSISNAVELVLDSLPPGSTINAGPDTILYSFDYIVQMVADPPISGGAGKWTVLEGTGIFDKDTDYRTKVSGLSKGLNRYLWTVTHGACKLQDQVDVTVLDLVIPEGFSPNNDPDGYNNTFIISGLDLPNQNAELTIINSAGTEVFSTSNRSGHQWTEWDGRNAKGADLPEGTYYYLLKLTSKGNGAVFKKSGFIILKRY
ncbi:MAG: gliding motility-associated C-terminal domain-containing protein [Bacteroidota bacterium]|nr:gliding motility-associated C-terminal domain-containing protein [Bacteroidota bacterium]